MKARRPAQESAGQRDIAETGRVETMRQTRRELDLETTGRSLTEITGAAREFVAASGVRDGLLTLFCRHTTASLLIQENADPDVRLDLVDAFDRLAPEDANWRHGAEGLDDMPGHVKAALSPAALSIPVVDGTPALGTWQGIYLAEWRARGRARRVLMHVIGDA